MELIHWLIITHGAWRGQFVDLWTLPHIISGIVIAYILLYWAISVRRGFWIALIVGITWEVFEHVTGLSRTEALTNAFMDIFTSQMGYLFGAYLFQEITTPLWRQRIMMVLGVKYVAIVMLGFAAFKYYG